MMMLKIYIKTALRSIFRRRTDAWINIIGLALGLSITLLIWMHVFYELSYDRFFDDHQRIYRVHNTMHMYSEEPLTIPSCMFYFGERALEQLPEVEQMTRLNTHHINNPNLRAGEKVINTQIIAAADSAFFEVFPMKFLAGDPSTALAEPGSLVLTYSIAQSLFENPLLSINQTIQVNDINHQVTAIIEDLPENTHMTFNGLASMHDVHEGMKESGFSFFTYLKLNPGTDIESLEAQLSHLAEQVVLANAYFKGESMPIDVRLKRLSAIHLTSNLIWEMKGNGSQRNVQIFSAMSVFILLLALINYVNMATAKSSLRAKEIGLRKVAGSSRSCLIRQFMVESFMITFLAFIMALLLAENFSGFFSGRLGINIHAGLMYTANGLLALAGLFVFTSIIAGLYPAFYLSSFNAVSILKGEMVKGTRGQFFRRSLVVFQFAITIFLLSSLLVLAMQLRYMVRQGLGYEKEYVMIARDLPGPVRRSFADVATRLEALEGVAEVSGANFLFGESNHIEVISEHGNSNDKVVTADILSVDEKFIPMMQISIDEGRNFHSSSEFDAQGAYVLNKAAVAAMGLNDPMQSRINVAGNVGPVIGVVDDFQLKSLHNAIDPMVFRYTRTSFPQLYIKLHPGNMLQMRESISGIFNEFDPTWFPNLMFLDERLEAQYSRERQSTNLLGAGSVLAILISLLGVYGLAAFAVERRVREIGIRKVLGASGKSILWAFNKEFCLLVIIAFLIAAPLSWWVMEGWLNNFISRVQLNVLWFIWPAVIALLLNAAIISLQVWKAAKGNPVVALKTQ